MNTELFVESTFSLAPNDVIQDRHHGRMDLNYWVGDGNEPAAAYVSIDGQEPQIIGIEWQDITYGKKAYFVCQCGERASKLHLPVRGKQFKCRACHGLRYQLTTFNRNSIAGQSLYRMNRLQKLIASRESMGRILYNGNYTKKFERFLGLCERAGYNDIVKALIQR
jgi:hypothetical protein